PTRFHSSSLVQSQVQPALVENHLRREHRPASYWATRPWRASATLPSSTPSHVCWARSQRPVSRATWLAACAVGPIPVGNQSRRASYPARRACQIASAPLG